MDLLLSICNISGGILLAVATLDKWDGESNFFNKIAKFLVPFQTIIGGTLLVLSLLAIFKGAFLYSLIGIAGGILLFVHVLAKIPSVGDVLKRISDQLSPFKSIVGIAMMVIGILWLFR